MDERLRPTERLKTSEDYRRVFQKGACFRTRALRIHHLPRGLELSRLGLVVSRHVGKATVRNRVRRLLREVFRRKKCELPRPADVILVPQGLPRSFEEYSKAFGEFIAWARSGAQQAGSRGGGKKGGKK